MWLLYIEWNSQCDDVSSQSAMTRWEVGNEATIDVLGLFFPLLESRLQRKHKDREKAVVAYNTGPLLKLQLRGMQTIRLPWCSPSPLFKDFLPPTC